MKLLTGLFTKQRARQAAQQRNNSSRREAGHRDPRTARAAGKSAQAATACEPGCLQWQTNPLLADRPGQRLSRAVQQRSSDNPSVILAVGVLLVFCNYSAPSAMGASSFSPLPNHPTFALTNPIILVSPTTLNFGPVPMGERVTKDFLVENIGRGKLVGTASVPAPFKIISDRNYALKENAIQVVTVEYTPGRSGTNTATVTFTGGGGAKALVTGKRLGQ